MHCLRSTEVIADAASYEKEEVQGGGPALTRASRKGRKVFHVGPDSTPVVLTTEESWINLRTMVADARAIKLAPPSSIEGVRCNDEHVNTLLSKWAFMNSGPCSKYCRPWLRRMRLRSLLLRLGTAATGFWENMNMADLKVAISERQGNFGLRRPALMRPTAACQLV